MKRDIPSWSAAPWLILVTVWTYVLAGLAGLLAYLRADMWAFIVWASLAAVVAFEVWIRRPDYRTRIRQICMECGWSGHQRKGHRCRSGGSVP